MVSRVGLRELDPRILGSVGDWYGVFGMEISRHDDSGSGSGSGAGERVPGASVLSEVINRTSMSELNARIRKILRNGVAALFRAELPELFRVDQDRHDGVF